MQIEAIYNHGRLELPGQIRFAHQRFTVRIDVPDDIIVTHEVSQSEGHARTSYTLPPEVAALSQAMADRLERIRNAPLPPDEQLPPLTQKQYNRMDAFAFRDELRKMRI